MITLQKSISINSPDQALLKLNLKDKICLFESTEITEEGGQLSVLGFDPPLEFKGKNDTCEIIIFHEERAQPFLDVLETKFSKFIQSKNNEKWTLEIPKLEFKGSENERVERQNTAQIIRTLLKEFKTEEKTYLGLYGAFSYYFVYQFEEIKRKKESSTDDFHLFLFDTVIEFNHISKKSELFIYRENEQIAEEYFSEINSKLQQNEYSQNSKPAKITNINYSPSDEEFKKQVEKAIEYCNLGEFMEVVISRKITGNIQGEPYEIYKNYKKVNPSPYLFYFELNGETLLGASPEIMVKCQNRKVTLKPISGTVRRGTNPLEDHINMMNLLNSEKEKAELDMLIDLGRNDLSRICKAGINIEQYRSVEKYSHVYHTIAKVSGTLEDEFSGFDALINCLNAGTLTGAPKIAAMNFIEEVESHERGYYGGSVGFVTFDGEVNTAITIRTVHIENENLNYLSGATLLYESTPEGELDETHNKAAAFMKAIEPFLEK
ncbi:MAG: anthranilate synthase component I family protein [Flavobacteriales bacterium]|nr:anthranilate synthase component I family protein [Flavobacteriales bacterium]